MDRKIDVIDAFDGKKMVVIHDIVFMKKRYVEWKDVKEYLKQYVGDVYAIPVYDNDGEVDHYNVFHASLLIRHAEDGKKYLYDIIDIKKETSYPLEP